MVPIFQRPVWHFNEHALSEDLHLRQGKGGAHSLDRIGEILASNGRLLLPLWWTQFGIIRFSSADREVMNHPG